MRHSALKHAATIKVSNVDKKSVDGELPVQVINYTDVYYGNRLGPAPELKRATATAQQLADFRLRTGDVLITKDSESADDIGVAAYVEGAAPDLVCGYHLAMLRPQSETNGRFLFWAVSSLSTQRQFETSATGVTRYGLRSDAIGGTTIPLPPLAEQRAIADYLDVETARIDALITKKQQLIHLLEERRRPFIQEAVDAAATQCPHIPLRHVLQEVDERGHPDREVLSVYRELGVVPKASRSDNHNKTPSDLSNYKSVSRGDVVVNKMKAWQGSIAVSGFDGIVSGDYLVCRWIGPPTMSRFVHYVLRSPKAIDEYQLRSTGIRPSQWRLYWDELAELMFPLCSDESQNALVSAVDDRIDSDQQLVERLTRQIALLTERRQALITAAVTGEFTVPGAP